MNPCIHCQLEEFVYVGVVTKRLRRWAEEAGVDIHLIRARLARGWHIHDAAMTPPRRRRQLSALQAASQSPAIDLCASSSDILPAQTSR